MTTYQAGSLCLFLFVLFLCAILFPASWKLDRYRIPLILYSLLGTFLCGILTFVLGVFER